MESDLNDEGKAIKYYKKIQYPFRGIFERGAITGGSSISGEVIRSVPGDILRDAVIFFRRYLL